MRQREYAPYIWIRMWNLASDGCGMLQGRRGGGSGARQVSQRALLQQGNCAPCAAQTRAQRTCIRRTRRPGWRRGSRRSRAGTGGRSRRSAAWRASTTTTALGAAPATHSFMTIHRSALPSVWSSSLTLNVTASRFGLAPGSCEVGRDGQAGSAQELEETSSRLALAGRTIVIFSLS